MERLPEDFYTRQIRSINDLLRILEGFKSDPAIVNEANKMLSLDTKVLQQMKRVGGDDFTNIIESQDLADACDEMIKLARTKRNELQSLIDNANKQKPLTPSTLLLVLTAKIREQIKIMATAKLSVPPHDTFVPPGTKRAFTTSTL